MARKGVKNIQATPKVVDGIQFASTAEANRYTELLLLQAANEIKGLIVHPTFQLSNEVLKVCYLNNKKVRTYTGDFMYTERSTGSTVVEDVKGLTTPVASLRMSIFKAIYPEVELRVVTNKKRKKRRLTSKRRKKKA